MGVYPYFYGVGTKGALNPTVMVSFSKQCVSTPMESHSKQRVDTPMVSHSKQRVVESIFPQDFAKWFDRKKELRDQLYDLLHTLMAHEPCTDIYDGTRDECINPSCLWTAGLWRHLKGCLYCDDFVFLESHMLVRHWVDCHSNFCYLCKDMVTPRDLDLKSFDFLLKAMGYSCDREPMNRNAQVLFLQRVRRQIEAPDSSFHRCYLCLKKRRAMLKRKPLKPTKAHYHVRPSIFTTGRPLTVQEVIEEGVECQGMHEYQEEAGVPEEHPPEDYQEETGVPEEHPPEDYQEETGVPEEHPPEDYKEETGVAEKHPPEDEACFNSIAETVEQEVKEDHDEKEDGELSDDSLPSFRFNRPSPPQKEYFAYYMELTKDLDSVDSSSTYNGDQE